MDANTVHIAIKGACIGAVAALTLGTLFKNINALSTGEKMILPGALVLFIAGFLPWYELDLGPFGSVTRNGWESPGAFWSTMAILIGLAMAGAVAAKHTRTVDMADNVGSSTWPRIHLAAGVAALMFLLIKLLGNHDYTALGLYLGIFGAGALAVGGFLMFIEESTA